MIFSYLKFKKVHMEGGFFCNWSIKSNGTPLSNIPVIKKPSIERAFLYAKNTILLYFERWNWKLGMYDIPWSIDRQKSIIQPPVPS